jgi:hypothetical protein
VSLFRGPVHRRRDGTFAIDLGENERRLIETLVEQLRELLTTDSPVLERLFPPPYGDDRDRNEGYAALAHPELIDQRLAALATVEASVDATSLDEDQLMAWMRSINDLRLVLGTVLEIAEDGEVPQVDDDNAATFQAYEFLGYLLELVVGALSDD